MPSRHERGGRPSAIARRSGNWNTPVTGARTANTRPRGARNLGYGAAREARAPRRMVLPPDDVPSSLKSSTESRWHGRVPKGQPDLQK